MRNEEYTVIQGWMYALDLTDKQRMAYAIIWGYSRDGRSVCRTTAKQLSEWLDCTPRNAQYIIRQLEDRGLIGHEVVAVSARRGHPAGVMTDFWAILPDQAEKPGKKARIDWVGRAKVTKRISQVGYETDFVTPHRDTTRNKYISGAGGGCKNNARSRAKKTTTTTGFLFENSEVIIPEALAEDPCFMEWWEKLRRQPKWIGKTAEALEIELTRLDLLDDPIQAAWSCMKAIERDWATIKDPSQLFCDDQEAAMTWIDAENERRKAA